jgi:DNA-binding NtrC family response regulator
MSKPLRVLQIEDSDSDSELLLLLLMQAGYEVCCTRVEDAEELRHALKDPAWDVVIADYHLPSFDAPKALKILRESGREIPCIVVSGKMGEEVAVEVMKCGADDYLVKSNLPRLIPALERELSERSRRREKRQAQEELREHQERLALAVDSDRKQREQPAQEQWESVRRQARGLLHDFNNLLAVINGYTQMILAEARAEDPLRAPAEELAKAALRAGGLARQLAALSRSAETETKSLAA